MELPYSLLRQPFTTLTGFLGWSRKHTISLNADKLFETIEEDFPLRHKDAWYILAETALVGCGRPEALADLYKYVTKTITSDDERNRVNKRLRDCLQKTWILTGIAPVLAGVGAFASAEKELGHVNEGGLSPHWQTIQLNDESLARGRAFVDRLYAHNLRPTFENLWGSHLDDIRWQQENVIYGVFLSEHSILSATETELVSMSALFCGDIVAPKLWHMRGFRRLGPTLEESERINRCLRLVAEWAGRDTSLWPVPADVEAEV